MLWSYNIDLSNLKTTLNMTSIDNCVYIIHHLLWLAEVILFSITTNEHNLLCVLSLDEMHSKKKDILVQYVVFPFKFYYIFLKIYKTAHVIKRYINKNLIYKLKFFFHSRFYQADNSIEYIIPSPDINTAYIIIDCKVFKYIKDTERLERKNILFIKELRYYVEVIKVEAIKIDSKDVIISLSSANCFSIDGKEIAKNITSFYVHSNFLLLITQQHTLICVPLNENGIQQLSKHDLTVKPWENGSNEISLAGKFLFLYNPYYTHLYIIIFLSLTYYVSLQASISDEWKRILI